MTTVYCQCNRCNHRFWFAPLQLDKLCPNCGSGSWFGDDVADGEQSESACNEHLDRIFGE